MDQIQHLFIKKSFLGGFAEESRLIEFYFPVCPSSPLQEFSDSDMENLNSSWLKGIIQKEFYIPTRFVEISTNIRIRDIKMKEKSCSGNSTVTSSGGHVFISHKYQSGNLHVCSWISLCSCCLRSCQDLGNVEGSWRGWKREIQRKSEAPLLLFHRWRSQILRWDMLSQRRWTSQSKSWLFCKGWSHTSYALPLLVLQPICSCSSHCSTITTGLPLKELL